MVPPSLRRTSLPATSKPVTAASRARRSPSPPRAAIMEFSYPTSDMHRRYDLGRSLAIGGTEALMETLRRHASAEGRLVVDLGCGTGRFSAALSDTFHVPVPGLEGQ